MTAPSKIKSTSYSRLLDFESCPLKAKLKIIDKIPEPERALRPGQTEHANDRGSRIHDECEQYLRGNGPMPVEAAKYFQDEMASLKTHFAAGNASLEGEWAFNKDWEPVDWKVGWLRIKLDANIMLGRDAAVAVDYKSGRRFGNEIKHGEQLQLYALSVLIRYPQIKFVTTELWYFDVNDLARSEFSREQGLRLLKGFNRRFNRMTNATTFPATPNMESCKYCPYHPAKGSGDCQVGV